jgi:hypothetical protein
MGVLTFRVNRDQAEGPGRVSVQGNSSMAGNNASEGGYVEYIDNMAPDSDVVPVGQLGLRDLLWLRNTEFEDHVPPHDVRRVRRVPVEHFLSLQ